jgi:hypothetical protein
MKKPTGQGMPDGRNVKGKLPTNGKSAAAPELGYSDSAESTSPNRSNVSPLKRDSFTDWIG